MRHGHTHTSAHACCSRVEAKRVRGRGGSLLEQADCTTRRHVFGEATGQFGAERPSVPGHVSGRGDASDGRAAVRGRASAPCNPPRPLRPSLSSRCFPRATREGWPCCDGTQLMMPPPSPTVSPRQACVTPLSAASHQADRPHLDTPPRPHNTTPVGAAHAAKASVGHYTPRSIPSDLVAQ